MTDPATRGRALDVLARLPDGWRVGTLSSDPGSRSWSVTARGPHPGRARGQGPLTGTEEGERPAMAELRVRLDERQLAARDVEIKP